MVGAGLAGLAAARELRGGRPRRGRARGARPGRRADAERADRRRQGRRDRRPVGRADPGPGAGADRRARARDLPDLRAGQEHLRARRPAAPLLGDDPEASTRSASPRSALAMQRLNRMAAEVPPEAPWRAPKAERLGLGDLRDLDAPQRPHRGRPRHPAAGDHRRLGGRAARRLAAARPLLHPLGGLARDPHRHRGRRPAGPGRRRHAADLAADGRAARRRGGRARRRRCARSATATRA